MSFPIHRSRRLRRHPGIRRLVAETRLHPADLIQPLFVCPGTKVQHDIAAMPSVAQMSVDLLVEEAKRLGDLGISAVLLFGTPQKKDDTGSEAWSDSGAVQHALRALKKECPSLYLITDVCLCAYTNCGHCGLPSDHGTVLNDTSIELLGQIAASHAKHGADMVAPSDMMDGRVAAIRRALDNAKFQYTPIMSYAAKYASAFYGPFREAQDSTPQFGDRKTYQMDPANRREAVREVLQDIDEGADMVMVKPAMPYLDVLSDIRAAVDVPVAAYQVSGEYAMIKAAAQNGWLDERAAAFESLLSIKRAGADNIITYFAKDIAAQL
ncbi:MAG: porphobilinogen synthase [Deltaproteobacteria bacterium CG11_big_fil_rev_8_21_14_0_20_47_16]|nr:MAG: porphobilinogen synthase [Deltaproteobacteria bacterium CG11_big_fil_rev_8_21_14_0_20_47_16]